MAMPKGGCECPCSLFCSVIRSGNVPTGVDRKNWLENVQHTLEENPNAIWEALRGTMCMLNTEYWDSLDIELQSELYSLRENVLQRVDDLDRE